MPFIEHNGRRLLFLHIPKTGGGAIEDWMESVSPLHFHSVGIPSSLRCTPQHFRMSDFRVLFGDSFFDHAIMVVRNPYDRIESEYRMRAFLDGQGFWKRWATFSHWLEQTLEAATKNKFHLDNHVRPQWHFYGSNVEVFKYEDGLLKAAERMAELLGTDRPESLPVKHKAPELETKVVWDEIDRCSVAEFYGKDFEVFGY